ncbi:hypothetical protein D3C72_2087410 [compost metagenome]
MPDRVGLVADDEAAKAPVDFGHDEEHRHVLGGKPLAVGCPLRLGAAGLDELDDGCVTGREGIGLVVEAVDAEGEAGEVEDG